MRDDANRRKRLDWLSRTVEVYGGRLHAFVRMAETEYPELNAALSLLYAKREQFLAVLEYPHLPLHYNLSENDIREYARLRKIRAGTRSDQGRRCRDTFLSLKTSCRKLGISLRAFLHDLLTRAGQIPLLSHVIRSLAKQGPPPVAATP